MIVLILKGLVPFMVFYFASILSFSIMFLTLHTEIDGEVDDAKDEPYFFLIFLQVFRTSIGELATPGYTKLTA